MYFEGNLAPLIGCEDIFLVYNEDTFVLCLVMKKAGTDLKKILAEKKNGLSFLELHSVYKDIVTGIVYMHSQNLAHLDIKPENFLLINERYYLSDFGTGLDLHYEEKREKKTFF